MIEQAIEAFVLEAEELLNDLEDMILGLEEDASQSRVDEIFRALHTVKGSGAMFAHTALSRFTHHFESAFELVRSGNLAVSGGLIDLSLKSRDVMMRFLELGGDGPNSEILLESDEATALIEALAQLTGAPKADLSVISEQEGNENTAEIEEYFEIEFKPDGTALKNGMRPDLLLRELSELGHCDARYTTADLPRLSELDPEFSYLDP